MSLSGVRRPVAALPKRYANMTSPDAVPIASPRVARRSTKFAGNVVLTATVVSIEPPRSLTRAARNDSVDILAALGALTAVGLAMYDAERFLAADHDGGFAIGLIVILTGLRVLRDASLELMDTMPSGAMIDRVRSEALSVPGVRAVDKSYARKTGFKYHVDIHIEVDPTLTVAASHVIAGQVRSRLRDELGWVADVLVHVEPTRDDRPVI
jgi:cation diffusion facilitator family transporter